MSFIGQLGMQLAQGVLGGGLGSIFGNIGNNQQYKQQEKLQALQIKGQKELTDYNTMKQLQMWMDTNYPAQVEQLKKAGLNPALLYGHGGGGGATAHIAQGSIGGGQAQNHAALMANTGMGLNASMLTAQIENIKADTNKKNVEAGKLGGVDTEKTWAEIDNIVAATKNTVVQTEWNKIKKGIDEIELKFQSNELNYEARENMLMQQWDQTKEATLQMQAKTAIDRATQQSVIDAARQQLTNLQIEAALKQAQTEATKKGLQLTDQQIAESKATIQKWAQELLNQGRGLDQKDREIGIQAMKAEFDATHPSIWNALGSAVERTVNWLDEISGTENWGKPKPKKK